MAAQTIIIVTNEYSNNLLKLLQSQLNILNHISPVPFPIQGIMTMTIAEKSNNKLTQLQNQLEYLRRR